MPQLANFITSTASLHTLWDPASFLYNILSVPINIYLKHAVQKLLIKFPEKKKKKIGTSSKDEGKGHELSKSSDNDEKSRVTYLQT